MQPETCSSPTPATTRSRRFRPAAAPFRRSPLASTPPLGVAVDRLGNVFVADYGNNAVKEIPAGGGTVQTLGSGSGFDGPSGVAVNAAGDVFVANANNNTVKEIPADGGAVQRWIPASTIRRAWRWMQPATCSAPTAVTTASSFRRRADRQRLFAERLTATAVSAGSTGWPRARPISIAPWPPALLASSPTPSSRRNRSPRSRRRQ